jgi:hypothetical protein
MNTTESNRKDTHGRWHELLSPTQALVEPLNSDNNTKKKKCRGNRKVQNFRRRCRAKGMNNETIEILLASKDSNKQIQYQNQETLIANTNSASEHINNNNISIFKFIEKQVYKKRQMKILIMLLFSFFLFIHRILRLKVNLQKNS